MVYGMKFAHVPEDDDLLVKLALLAIIIATRRRPTDLCRLGAVACGNAKCLADLLEIFRILVHTDVGKR